MAAPIPVTSGRFRSNGPFGLGLVVCLVPFTWVGPGAVLHTGDYNIPYDSEGVARALLEGWSADNLGSPTHRLVPHLFPFLAFWRVGQAVGFPTSAVQELLLAALFALAYGSAWRLVGFLTCAPPNLAKTVVALVYAFNPFTLYSFAVGHSVAFLAYAAAPLWITAILRSVRAPLRITSGFLPALVSLLFASSFDNPAIILSLIVLPTVVFLGIELRSKTVELRKMAAWALRAAIWLLLLHAWWVIPGLTAAVSSDTYRYAGSSQELFEWPALATPVHFSEFLRGHGYWGQYASYKGEPYLAWGPSLTRSPLIICSWLLSALPFAALLFWRRPRPWMAAAAGLFLTAAALSKGINPPLSDVNRWLYVHVPGFFVFRGTYEKFGGLVFLGVLLGGSALLLTPLLAGKRRSAGTALLAAAVVGSSWPLFTGDVAPESNNLGVKSAIRIPEDYKRLSRWSESTADIGTVVVVPQTGTGYVKTEWGFAGADFISNFSRAPVVTGEPEAAAEDAGRYQLLLEVLAHPEHAGLIRRAGVSHVAVRHDIDVDFYPGTTAPEAFEERLESAQFTKVATFGAVALWQPPLPAGPVSVFPAANDDAGRLDSLIRAGATSGIPTSTSFRLTSASPGELSGHADLQGLTWVYLAQDFSSKWRLTARSASGVRQRVTHHVQPGGFGNAWLVDGKGDTTFRLQFGSPIWQKLYIFLSLVGLLCGGLTCLLFRTKESTI